MDPRSLLLGIEAWGHHRTGHSVCMPQLAVLLSVFSSPVRPREEHLGPALDSAHFRRAWADERGGLACHCLPCESPLCSRHPSKQVLTLASGFSFVQRRNRMGLSPWKCSP